ncbi:MAG: hypothetical protein HQK52_21025 [Oligoflexia bacterium]|nr:hypothetical protein [Oligoflexia bacterium]
MKKALLILLALLPISSISFAAKAALNVDYFSPDSENLIRINGEVYRLDHIDRKELNPKTMMEIPNLEDMLEEKESISLGVGPSTHT